LNCKFDDNIEASDAELLGPGSAVADSSASERTTDDEVPMSPDTILVPLMGDKIAYPVCERRKMHLFFMTLSDLDKHLNEHHLETPIKWGCRKCGKCFQKLHGARCHIPKCSDTMQVSKGRFSCDACPMSFGSQKGLSIHERHAHLAVRSIKRKGTEPPPPVSQSGKVKLLRELDSIYKDHMYPNEEISKILTTKTADQIRRKRKTLKTVNIERNLQEGALQIESECDLIEPFMASAGQERQNTNEQTVHEWQQYLLNEIGKQTEVPPILREMYARMNKAWEKGKRDKEALVKNLYKYFNVHLYEALKDKRKKLQSSQNNKEYKKTGKSKNH
jgi:hypothetical protein